MSIRVVSLAVVLLSGMLVACGEEESESGTSVAGSDKEPASVAGSDKEQELRRNLKHVTILIEQYEAKGQHVPELRAYKALLESELTKLQGN